MSSIVQNSPIKKSTIDRFWNKVLILSDDECWEWQACTRRGYGDFSFRCKATYAHRMSYMIVNGDIPNGMCILHECDNPICVNPNHLFLGTNLDNAKDRDKKGRTCKGSRYWSAKLTKKDALKIRKLYKSGEYTQKEISEMFDVNSRSISNVITGKTWAWVK